MVAAFAPLIISAVLVLADASRGQVLLGAALAIASLILLILFQIWILPTSTKGSRNRGLRSISTMLPPIVVTVSVIEIAANSYIAAGVAVISGIALSAALLMVTRHCWHRNFEVAHLPGAPQKYRPSIEQRVVLGRVSGLLGAVFLNFIVVVLPVPSAVRSIMYALVGVIVLIWTFPVIAHAMYLRQLNAAWKSYSPTFAVFHDGVNQIHWQMWLPYITKCGEPVIQVATRRDNFVMRAETSSIPIVFPGQDSDDTELLALFSKSLKAVFYPRNGKTNTVIIKELPECKHVFLHHGDGDKAASSSAGAARHDILVVAGQAAIDRYAMRGIEIPRSKFRILGRPMAAEFEEVTVALREVNQPVILYAPTWRGPNEKQNYSSLDFAPAMIERLLQRDVTVIFRPHPSGQNHPPHKQAIAAVKQMLQQDHEQTGRKHVWGAAAETQRSFADVANMSDMMIADVSGTITDYMQTLKPFAMISTKMSAEEFIEAFPSAHSAYVVEGEDLESLDEALDLAMGDDPLASVRKERRSYYLGGFSGNESLEAFVQYLRELAAE